MPCNIVMMYETIMSQLAKMALLIMGSLARRTSYQPNPTSEMAPPIIDTNTAADFQAYIVPPVVSPKTKTVVLATNHRLPIQSNRFSLCATWPGTADWLRWKYTSTTPIAIMGRLMY
jgi:hypothetical protein